MRSDALDAVLTAFADEPFTLHHARLAGVSKRQVQYLVATGRLESPLLGTYWSPGPPATIERRASAASLLLPEGGALARRTATWLYGVDARSPGERDVPLLVECAVPFGVEPLRRPGIRCFQTHLDEDDVDEFSGLRCTVPDRTAADLLRWLPPHMGLAAADALAGLGAISSETVLERLRRRKGDRFVRKARQLAFWMEPRSESFGESWLRLRFLEAGFPRPTAQIPIPDDTGRVKFRLDLGWRDRRLAVEYDGEEHHTSPADRARDLARREWMRSERDWTVIGVGKSEVLGPKLTLERAVGELLGLEPRTRRRAW